MISLAEAQARILDSIVPLEPREVARADALGLVLTDAVVATDDVPPFANTAMDGYALRADDTIGAAEGAPVRLRVVGELRAGQAPGVVVGPGEAVRIMTGAPVPVGADAIVMVERTERDGDGVLVAAAARAGDHVRPAGGDIATGAIVFEPGTVVRPAHVGVLASLGVSTVRAVRRARVAVCSTGDELVERGELAPGQIRDSNRPMLCALLSAAGCEPVDLGLVRDDEAAVTEVIEHAARTCDALLTSGGVSVGDYDYVKVVLDRLGSSWADGGETWWAQVAIKPAKPLAFARLGRVPVFGLPGNPVSSSVGFELFARPALLRMMGHARPFRLEVTATAAAPFPRRPDGKVHFDRVRVGAGDDGALQCERAGAQASNVLSGMAAANGLAILPDGDGVEAGAPVRVMLLDS